MNLYNKKNDDRKYNRDNIRGNNRKKGRNGEKTLYYMAIVAGMAVFLITVATLFSLIQARESIALKNRSITVLSEVSELTEQVVLSIEKSILVLRGYEAFIITMPDISEETTLKYLENLVGENKLIRNVTIIKDTTIIYSYPKEGNEKAIGVDIAKIPEQSKELLKVKELLQPLFFGPVDLVQGGRGYIARTPVIAEGEYWGQISVVLKAEEVEKLFVRNAEILGLDFCLFRGSHLDGDFLMGDTSIMERKPVFLDSTIYGTKYELAALEKVKEKNYLNFTWLYLGAILISLTFGALVFIAFLRTRQVKRQASLDQLTKVYNRAHLDNYVKGIFQKTKSKDFMTGLVVLDIDDFKQINDLHGHLAGDAVLRAAAEKMWQVCRNMDAVFRMGGDEFLIVLREIVSREAFEAIIQRINQDLSFVFTYKNVEIPVSFSVGYALHPEDGEEFDGLFKCADDKMYHEKKENNTKFVK